jgi:hypothetical protein
MNFSLTHSVNINDKEKDVFNIYLYFFNINFVFVLFFDIFVLIL